MKAPGFTLVEMLVALLIFAMLSAVGVTVMAYAADNQGVVKARMDRLGELQSARALLKADLAQAAVRRVRGRDGNPARTAFIRPAQRRVGQECVSTCRCRWSASHAKKHKHR